MLVRSRGFSQSIELNEAGTRVRFGGAGSDGIVSQVPLEDDQGRAVMAVALEPLTEGEGVFPAKLLPGTLRR